MGSVPCLRCRRPLVEAPTTAARIYLCLWCIEILGGEKKAAKTLRREFSASPRSPSNTDGDPTR